MLKTEIMISVVFIKQSMRQLISRSNDMVQITFCVKVNNFFKFYVKYLCALFHYLGMHFIFYELFMLKLPNTKQLWNFLLFRLSSVSNKF